MSVMEDSRKVLQDFIAPELPELSAHVGALEKRVDRFEVRVDKRFDEVMTILRQLMDVKELSQRVTRRLESKETSSRQA
jgi:hypothetical protein